VHHRGELALAVRRRHAAPAHRVDRGGAGHEAELAGDV
jgi:hypothetical protein